MVYFFISTWPIANCICIRTKTITVIPVSVTSASRSSHGLMFVGSNAQVVTAVILNIILSSVLYTNVVYFLLAGIVDTR